MAAKSNDQNSNDTQIKVRPLLGPAHIIFSDDSAHSDYRAMVSQMVADTIVSDEPQPEETIDSQPLVNQVHFQSIESAICQYINYYPWLKLAAAWLTNDRIIAALNSVEATVIIGHTTKIIAGQPDYSQDYHHKMITNCKCLKMYPKLDNIHLFHHKFIVFGDYDLLGQPQVKAVWTGSYNFTNNANNNLENGLLLVDADIAGKYQQYFDQIYQEAKFIV